jgi:plastocyanin
MNKVLGLILMLPLLAFATEDVFTIQIKNHRFEPAELAVPAGKKVKLLIENLDATPEEFESHELNREKVIAGNGKTTIYIGPLSAGKYPYYGEFNQATANGVIIAK